MENVQACSTANSTPTYITFIACVSFSTQTVRSFAVNQLVFEPIITSAVQFPTYRLTETINELFQVHVTIRLHSVLAMHALINMFHLFF